MTRWRALAGAVLMATGIAGASEHEKTMKRGWAERDGGRYWECAKQFARATHLAARERKGRQAMARAGYWTARCARESGSRQGEKWERWLSEHFGGSFHASLIARNGAKMRRGHPTWRQWVNSIIEVESRGNPHAVSHKGAIGLMQVMPETARGLVHRETPEEVTAQCLRDGECNRRLGERYLQQMLEALDGQWLGALYAYNAGPRRARAWMKKRGKGDPIEAIDRIEIEETRNYVAKVMASLWKRARARAEHCATLEGIKAGRWPKITAGG